MFEDVEVNWGLGGIVGAYRQYGTPSLDLLELIESTAKDAPLETYA
jgi:hypothetical protein